MAAREFVCYVLVSHDARRTYAGSTCDLARRLRQHNGEIVGGAKATRTGRPWRVLRVLRGFGPCQRSALRVEWRCKPHRGWHRRRGPGSAVERRLRLVDAACGWARREIGLELTVEDPAEVTRP